MEDASTAHESPRWWERVILLISLASLLAFGVLVEIRSAYLSTRKTDLGCYLRAGWAVRENIDIYSVTDDNWWHFAYPPAVAILMVPLADAPAGHPRPWMLPYALTVGIWFVVSSIALFLAIHLMARGIEEDARHPNDRVRFGSRRWWYLRTMPLFFCIAPVGCTLSRGQVNLLLLLLLAGMFAATRQGQRFRAGLWLAGAITLKVIPTLLLLDPLIRRDRRTCLGVAIGLAVMIGIIPSLVWGVSGAIKVHQGFVSGVLLPGLTMQGDPTRSQELTTMTATDNQSIQATIHNYLHPDRATRPKHPHFFTQVAHVGIGLLLLLGLFWAAPSRDSQDGRAQLLVFSGLILTMTLLSPVSHTHYFCLAIPAMMALVAADMARHPTRPAPTMRCLFLLAIVGICFTLPMLPYWTFRREAGLPLLGSLLLWIQIIRECRWSAIRHPATKTEVTMRERRLAA